MSLRVIGLFWIASMIDLDYNQLCGNSGSFLMRLISSEYTTLGALAFLPEGHHVLQSKKAKDSDRKVKNSIAQLVEIIKISDI